MSLQKPRDMREWQQYVERGLAEARRGTSIAISHADDKATVIRDEVDSYKNLTPTSPIELDYQTSTYIDVNGKRRGRVVVDFPDVVLSTDAQALTVNSYELSGQDQGSSPLDAWRTLATSDTSSLMAMDFAPGSVWKFRVRALSGNFTKPGLWSTETQVTITSDTTAPPQPSTPIVTANGGTLKVEWDGLAAGGGAMPADFARLEVYFGLATSPTTKITSFYEASFDVIPKSAYNAAHYFRFRAVDTSGNYSAYSTQASGTPTPLVDVDVILAKIDAATTEIVNIGAASILNGAINSTKLADNAVSQAKLQDQIISLAKLDTTVDAKITKGVTDSATAIANAAAADTKAGTAQTAADAARAVVDATIAAGAALNINGDFDATPITSPALGWPTRSLAIVQASATTARSGTNVLKCTPTTSSAYAYTDYFASATGRTFYVEFWVRLDQAVYAGNEVFNVGAFFSQMDTSGALTAPAVYSNGATYPAVPLSSLSTTTWTKFAVTYTVAQANNVKLRVGPRLPGSSGTPNSFEVDGFRVVDVTDAAAALAAAQAAQAKADSAFADAGTALVNAGNAQASANGKNNVYYLAAKPAGSSFADGDTVFIRSGVGAPITEQWKWIKTGPTTGSWNQETIGHQVLASIDLGKATIGELDGIYIKSKSIRANQLLVTDLTNFAPSLAESPNDWTLSGPMTIGTTSLDPSGWQFNTVDNATNAWARGPFMAVRPGESLYATATLYRNGSTSSPPGYLRYEWYDKDKAALTPGYAGAPQPSTSAGGTKFELTATVPATAAYARFVLVFSPVVGSGINAGWYNIMGYRQNSSVMIADGAVTADKVVANGITAKQILVGDFANIAIGSDFEDASAVPWNLHADHTISTATKKSGTSSLKLAAGTGARSSYFVGDLRVKEGEQYYFRYYAYIDSAFNGTTGNSKLRVGDQTGAIIADKTYANITPRSTWTSVPLELVITVPAGVTSLSVTLNNDNTAGTAYIDDIQIRRMSEASLIQNLGVEKLVASSASMDTATIDKLWSDVVRSRRMTTDMMVVGRGVNTITDEFFDGADTKTFRNTLCGGWGAWAVSGANNLNIYTQASLTPGTARSFYFDSIATYDRTSYIPVEAGQQYRLSVLYTSGTSGPRATVRYIKRDGTTAYQSAGWAKRDGTSNSYGAAGSLQTLERVYTVPADVTHIMPAVQFESTCTSATVYGGATFTNMTTASLIVDGAITTRNLTVTDDMVVALLNVHKISAGDIDTNSITSDGGFIASLTTTLLTTDKITAGMIGATSITSKHTITGATIQTTSTASRGIKLTSSSLKAYNSTGANTFTLDASTGDVTVTTLSTSASGARVKVWDRADGTAAVDLYTDTSGQHGSLYTQPQPGNGGYVTNIMHYTATPITANNWTTRLTLFADETWSIDQKTHAAEVTGDANGRVYIRGQFLKNNSAATETFVVGSTVTSQNATGTYTLTYYAPVGQGTRHVLATADSATVAQSCTQNCTASGFKWVWSTTASSSISMRYWAVWTD